MTTNDPTLPTENNPEPTEVPAVEPVQAAAEAIAATSEPEIDFDAEVQGTLGGDDAFEAASAEDVGNVASGNAEDVIFTRPQLATQTATTKIPRSKGGNPDEIEIPAKTRKEIDSRLDAAPNIDLVSSAKQSEWAATLLRSFNVMPMNDFYVDRLDKEGSSFKQEITHSGITMRGSAPTMKQKKGSIETEGARAILEMVTHLGVGGLFYAPMWHSGFWVMFRPATEDEQIDLNNDIASLKIEYMRQSYGLPLSASGIYSLDKVFQFALDHVYYTSVNSNEMPISEIRNYLAPQDIWSFLWGFLCANYPTGFYYSTACINEPNGCNHVESETLALPRLQWTDDSALSEWQKNHMTSRQPQSMKLEHVKRYQNDCLSMKPKRVVLVPGERGVAITFKPCTLTEYINESTAYVGSIVDAVTAALTTESDESARNRLVNMKIRASYVAQYAHWVKSIEFGDMTENADPDDASVRIVTDRMSITNQLRSLSAIDSVRENIMKEVKDYISNTTFSVIGVNSYECSACGTTNESDQYPRLTSVIPLDMFQVFFSLLTQRLSRIAAR